MAVAVVVVIIIVEVAVAVIIVAAVVMALGKSSEKNPEKSFLRKGGRSPSELLARDGARVVVISVPINVSPA